MADPKGPMLPEPYKGKGVKYAGEVIIGESQKIGFQPIKYQQNGDGSNTLILERWNNEKVIENVY